MNEAQAVTLRTPRCLDATATHQHLDSDSQWKPRLESAPMRRYPSEAIHKKLAEEELQRVDLGDDRTKAFNAGKSDTMPPESCHRSCLRQSPILPAPPNNRRSNKPQMERRRRQRINRCVNELKEFIMDAFNMSPNNHEKLEKADILEKTVKYLRYLKGKKLTTQIAGEDCKEVRLFPKCEPPQFTNENVCNISPKIKTSSAENSPITTTSDQPVTLVLPTILIPQNNGLNDHKLVTISGGGSSTILQQAPVISQPIVGSYPIVQVNFDRNYINNVNENGNQIVYSTQSNVVLPQQQAAPTISSQIAAPEIQQTTNKQYLVVCSKQPQPTEVVLPDTTTSDECDKEDRSLASPTSTFSSPSPPLKIPITRKSPSSSSCKKVLMPKNSQVFVASKHHLLVNPQVIRQNHRPRDLSANLAVLPPPQNLDMWRPWQV